MAKSRNHSLDYCTYLIVRLVVCVLQMLTLRQAYFVAELFAMVAYRIDRRHRMVAMENLMHAYGDTCNESRRMEMVREVYTHFCRLIVEIIQLPRQLHATNWRKHVEFAQTPLLVDMLTCGRPLLFVTGHFGNWEMGGYVLGLLGFSTHAVARPLDNPHLDQFLRSFRERTGQKLLAKKGDFDQMQSILQRGGVLATLADQDAGERGLFVDFFGRPASTHKAVALLAIEYNVPLVVTLARRVGTPLRYVVEIEDIIDPQDYVNKPDAVREITQRYTKSLENGIRKAPEQYFWLHRRWKHQPKQRKAMKAA